MASPKTVADGRVRDYKRERELAIKRGETASSDNPNPNAGDNRRHKARRAKEKQLGRKLPTSVHVDHKKPIVDGGSDKLSNLRVRNGKENMKAGGTRAASSSKSKPLPTRKPSRRK